LNKELFFKKTIKALPSFFHVIQYGPTCGVAVVNIILKMFCVPGMIFCVSYAPDKGASPKKMLSMLRRSGLVAARKEISIRNLKLPAILYIKLSDHYIVVGRIKNGKALIFDSAKNKPYWLKLSTLKRKWYGQKKNGWVIEVRKPNGPV